MDQVSEIREKLDIVSFIQEYIPLKRAGRNFKAPCPFHAEKTPSFVVSPERQIWHCFGCSKGGDVYTFLMEYEHMEFIEALRLLAKRAGVTLQSRYKDAAGSKKERLYELNSLASEFYHYVLVKHPGGEHALSYLAKRRVSEATVKTFLLGFAPRSGNVLSSYLIQKKKYPVGDVIDAGLAFQKGGDVVDFFRGRLMFPILDHRDNVIGFSGRVLDETKDSKYINTKDTLVYHKGETFFGMPTAKDAMRKANQVFLVEGEFDVISCFQEGIANTLAVKGTALTDKQVGLLARFVKKVTLCLDQDSAGQEAVKRSLPLLEARNLTTTVVIIPSGKDPDEAIAHDPFAFKKALKRDVAIYDYLLDRVLTTFDPTTAEGKKAITEDFLPLVSGIQNEIVKEHYLRKLSSALSTTFESLMREAEKKLQKKEGVAPTPSVPLRKSHEELLEEYLLSLIIQSKKPKTYLEDAVRILAGVISRERAYQKILHLLLSYFEKSDSFDGTMFAHGLPTELVTAFNTSFLLPIPKFPTEEKYQQEVRRVSEKLRSIYLRHKLKVLGDTIEDREKQEKSQDVALLKEEFSRVLGELEKKFPSQ